MAVNGWRRPWSAQPFGDVSASPLWIARKLVGAWGYDGSLPGRNIADSPGLGGLTSTNTTRTATPYGIATAFNGSSSFLTNTAQTAVTQLPVTFFARVYIGASKAARIFDISTGTTANDVIGIQQNSNGLRAQHYDGSNEGYAEIVNAGNLSRWITVAAVFDGLTSRAIYVDGGAQSATNTTSVVAPSGINRVTIGYAPWGTEYFNGTVSHALLFASALTAAEIMALHLDTLQVLAPRRIWVPVSAGGGGSFQAAWARNRSHVIGAGVR